MRDVVADLVVVMAVDIANSVPDQPGNDLTRRVVVKDGTYAVGVIVIPNRSTHTRVVFCTATHRWISTGRSSNIRR